jgi:alpha-tubulin suppressor-like RCC1 family protein
MGCTALTTLVLTQDHYVYQWTIEKESQLTLLATPEPNTFVKLACGGSHSLLITDKGKVFSFGSNKYGQLGLLTAHHCLI